MSEELQIFGLKELYDSLDTLGPKIARKIIRSGLTAVAKDVAEKIQEGAPILQPQTPNPHHRSAGQLKSAIKVVRKMGIASVVVSPQGFYWRFLEFGTVRMGARPFVRPAWDSVKYSIVENFAAYARARFDRAVKP